MITVFHDLIPIVSLLPVPCIERETLVWSGHVRLRKLKTPGRGPCISIVVVIFLCHRKDEAFVFNASVLAMFFSLYLALWDGKKRDAGKEVDHC